MTEQPRRGLVARTPAVELRGAVEPDTRASSGIDEVYVVAGHNARRGGKALLGALIAGLVACQTPHHPGTQ